MRIQRRNFKDNKERSSANLDPKIRRKLQSLARQFDCSESFVEATILADVLDIDLGEKYYEPKEQPLERVRQANKKVGSGKGSSKIAVFSKFRRYKNVG